MKVDPTVSILTSRGVLIAQTFLALTATLVLSRNFRELTGNLGAAIYAVFLVSLLFLSLLYIYNMHRRKLHRYCRAIPHLHYVNHIIRDTLAALKLGKDEFESESIDQNRQYLSTQLSNVLTSISQCFSVITGHNCAVCVKELDASGNQRTIARDIFSTASRRDRDTKKNFHGQPIQKSTASKVIVFGLQNQGRYFLSNNLPRLWRRKKYENISFTTHVPPKDTYLFGIPVRTRWPLPYKSTLVVPIRYIPEDNQNTLPRTSERSPTEHYWGFLCVDSAWKNCFDRRISPDLAMAFADALHILFSQFLLLEQIKPTGSKGDE